jgi:hypothetical protein
MSGTRCTASTQYSKSTVLSFRLQTTASRCLPSTRRRPGQLSAPMRLSRYCITLQQRESCRISRSSVLGADCKNAALNLVWIPRFEFTIAAGNSKPELRFDAVGRLSIYGMRIGKITAKTATVKGFGSSRAPLDWSSTRRILLWYYSILPRFHLWAPFPLSDGAS